MVELRRRHYPPPLGQDRRGTAESIERITAERVRKHHAAHFQPQRHHPVGRRQHRVAAAARPGRTALRRLARRRAARRSKLTQPPGGQRPPHEGHDADADRHRLPERAVRPPRLLRRARRGAGPLRRHGRPAVHRGAREARPVLRRLRPATRPSRTGQHPLLRRHDQRARPGNARRDRSASCSGCSDGVEPRRRSSACRPGSSRRSSCRRNRPRRGPARWRRTGTTWAGSAPFDEIQAAIDGADADEHRRPRAAAIRRATSPSSRSGRSR